MQISAKQIATILEAEIEGNADVIVSHPDKIEDGSTGGITFLANPRYEEYVYTTQASVVVVSQDFIAQKPIKVTLLKVGNVYEAFASLLSFYDQTIQQRPEGISSLAFIHPDATIGDEVSIGRFVTIEKDAVIGKGTVIFDQVYIGANVTIGEEVIIFPGARVMHQCKIGKQCVLHSNVVIGSDGFGFAPNENGQYSKIPQVGNVILEDHVDIGANSSIDRATMGSTIIRQGTKIDNLVQVGHNAEIGAHTVIAAQTGVAGSTKIGAHCRIGGQVGFAGHITIADGTQIQAQSGIAKSIKKPNQYFFGSPAIGYKDFIRSYGVFKKLPDIYRQLHRLEKEVERLKNEK